MHGNVLRSPTRRQAGSRRQKAPGSPGRVAKIDKALAAGPGLGDEQFAEVKRLRDEGERLHKTGHEGGVERLDTIGAGMVFGPAVIERYRNIRDSIQKELG